MKQSTKSLNLPKPIAAHFDTDKGDSETLSRCFTENAGMITQEVYASQERNCLWMAASLKYRCGTNDLIANSTTMRTRSRNDPPSTPVAFGSSVSLICSYIARAICGSGPGKTISPGG